MFGIKLHGLRALGASPRARFGVSPAPRTIGREEPAATPAEVRTPPGGRSPHPAAQVRLRGYLVRGILVGASLPRPCP